MALEECVFVAVVTTTWSGDPLPPPGALGPVRLSPLPSYRLLLEQ